MNDYIYSMKEIYEVTEYKLDQEELGKGYYNIVYYPTISKQFKKRKDAINYIKEMNQNQDLPFA